MATNCHTPLATIWLATHQRCCPSQVQGPPRPAVSSLVRPCTTVLLLCTTVHLCAQWRACSDVERSSISWEKGLSVVMVGLGVFLFLFAQDPEVQLPTLPTHPSLPVPLFTRLLLANVTAQVPTSRWRPSLGPSTTPLVQRLQPDSWIRRSCVCVTQCETPSPVLVRVDALLGRSLCNGSW